MVDPEYQKFWDNLPKPEKHHTIDELIGIQNDLIERHQHLIKTHDRVYDIGTTVHICTRYKATKVGRKIMIRSRLIGSVASDAYKMCMQKIREE